MEHNKQFLEEKLMDNQAAKTDKLSASAKRMKKLIISSYLELLGKYQFEKITIQLICEAAEINKSTFYNYFEDKYQLTKEIIHTVCSDFADEFVENIVDTSRTNFGLANFYGICEKYKPTLSRLYKIENLDLNIQNEISTAFHSAYKKMTKPHTPYNLEIESWVFAFYTFVPFKEFIMAPQPPTIEEFTKMTFYSFSNVYAMHTGVEANKLIDFILENTNNTNLKKL